MLKGQVHGPGKRWRPADHAGRHIDNLVAAAKQVCLDRETPRTRSTRLVGEANRILMEILMSGKELNSIFIGDNEIRIDFGQL